MPKDTKTLGNNKARACESLGFVHKKGCARVLTQPQGNYEIIKDYSAGGVTGVSSLVFQLPTSGAKLIVAPSLDNVKV